MITNQHAFDIMCVHARRQKVPGAVIREGYFTRCMYRTPEGNKCLAGALIPDEQYSEDMEGEECGTVWVLLEKYPDLRDVFPPDTGMVRDMQIAHDTCTVKHACNFLEALEEHFAGIAAAHGLFYP